MNEMNKETLSPAFADSSMPPGMAERRRLIQLAAGLVVGSTISGLPFVPQAAAQPVGGRRILIAYYSRTGTTREVARQIQKIVGGELFELRTVHRYPDEYRPTTEQAKREQEEGFRPQLTARVVHLPEIGIRGNTHFPFSDLNNVQIADLMSTFLAEKHLD